MASKSKQRPTRGTKTGSASKSPHGVPTRPGQVWHPAVLASLLVLMVAVAYLPALRCGFIWDDDAYVTENPLLTAPHGLHDIWLSAHTQSQYFPLVFTTFRCERLICGLNPFGFHLVNVMLHACNAVLVWLVSRRLQVPGAWLAAATFALHPVQVETVAWVTELKNLELLLFYLLSLLAWMKFVDPQGPPRWRYYGLALTACVLALFAKTTACTLPAAMVLVLWMRGQRITWFRAVQILPFLVVGFGLGLLSVWWEKHLGNYDEQFGLSLTLLQRVLLATRALWFYAGKLVWPANLAFSYPRWQLDPRQPLQYLPLAGCLAAAAVLWLWRDKIGRGALAGIVFFIAALSPLLGFIPEYTFFYSYVADHYQYTACIGLLAIFASLVWRWFANTGFLLVTQAALLLLLGSLTWHQCGAYRDRETLWRDTLAKNPGSWMAHHNLGIELFGQGRLDEALEHYSAAVELYPQGGHEQSDLGTALMEKGRYSEAIEHLEAAVAINPKLFQAQNNLALAYSRTGRDDQAISHFRQALQLKPDAMGVLLNLGRVLQRQGKLDEATESYREASRRFPSEVEPLRRLAGVLTEKEQFPEAAEACRQALKLAPNSPDLTRQLLLLEAHKTN